mgnify:CR=1 FL=1
MYKIEKLQVTNFRNLTNDIIEFSPKINCILGENGNGKTNILEAIHVLVNKKSFRKNTSFPQYLSIDGEQPEIIFSSIFKKDKNIKSVSGKIYSKSNEWYVDGKPSKKKIESKCVFINPFDSYNFHNTPSFRRDWFNQHFSDLSSDYKQTLKTYNQTLRFRNNLLSKKPSKYLEQIKIIDKDLSKLSVSLTNLRIFYIKELEKYSINTFKQIFSEDHELTINLDSKVIGMDEEAVFNLLQNNIQKDLIIGHTSYGVHKDDYVLLFDSFNSYDYCSLGQQKMSYLSLLFAYIELFRYNFVSYPIVLIDDVSGELDKFRWRKLIDYLEARDFQVLITTANEKFREELERIEGARRILVESGSIKSLN